MPLEHDIYAEPRCPRSVVRTVTRRLYRLVDRETPYGHRRLAVRNQRVQGLGIPDVAFRMRDVREMTPLLHMAVLFGMPFLLEKIIEASGTRSTGFKQETALHTAARARQVDAATRLVDAGEDVNAISYSGKTPLDVIMNRPYLRFEIRALETLDMVSTLVDAAAERMKTSNLRLRPDHLSRSTSTSGQRSSK